MFRRLGKCGICGRRRWSLAYGYDWGYVCNKSRGSCRPVPGHDEHPFRDLGRALAEAVFYRRAIFDPPPWPGWFDRLTPLWKKVKR